jgi:nuclear cap-binding protein subunit 1
MEISELPVSHPKWVFVSRVIKLEIRLSYYDRIKETVPSAFLDAGLMPSDAPGLIFEYEDSGETRSMIITTKIRKRSDL